MLQWPYTSCSIHSLFAGPWGCQHVWLLPAGVSFRQAGLLAVSAADTWTLGACGHTGVGNVYLLSILKQDTAAQGRLACYLRYRGCAIHM